MKKENEKQEIKPKVTIVLDCVPTNIEERKNNIRKFYDVCNEVIDDPSCFYTEQEIEQYRLMPNDILMTEGGDPDKLGRGAIIKEPMENSIHQNHIFRVRLNRELILPMFFEEYLQHQKAKRYFLRCAKQTTGIASINMKQLRALPVLIPSLELQNQFATFVHQIDKLKFEAVKILDCHRPL